MLKLCSFACDGKTRYGWGGGRGGGKKAAACLKFCCNVRRCGFGEIKSICFQI